MRLYFQKTLSVTLKHLFIILGHILHQVFGVKVQAVCCLWHLFGLFMGNLGPVITAAVWKHRKVKSSGLGDISVSMSHIYIKIILRISFFGSVRDAK